MPEITRPRPSENVGTDPVTARVHDTRDGLAALIAEAEAARGQRAEETPQNGGSAVCAWNHFENIPTFYNWNNRPR
ncbi:multiple cyclophane-containing RiPP AmcA [Actinoplanes sp. NPDC051851]|uniref:multiple cyclophane-containing RiPP AmcA n=1 Tax=Actinoplanes sp. NPDC051851 TaxID=3154753 RepID=UPI00341268A3